MGQDTQNFALIDDFGAFCIRQSDTSIRLARRKSQAIITVLAASPKRIETRGRIAGLLWSASTESGARTSLRQELLRLREHAHIGGDPLVEGDKFSIWLSKTEFKLTSQHVKDELGEGTVPSFLVSTPTPQDSFLSHLQGIDAELDIWIAVERASFENHCVEGLRAIVHTSDDEQVVENAARALINFDATDEDATAQLLRRLTNRNAVALAKQVYDTYCKTLRDDHGLAPASTIVQLINGDSKKISDTLPPAANVQPSSLLAPGTTRPLILAHPVPPHSGDENARMEAVRMDLLGALARFRDWSVRDWSANETVSAANWFEMKFHGIESMDGETVTVTLIAQPGAEILWSQSLPFSRDHGSQYRNDLVRKIAASLNMEISTRRIEGALSMPEPQRDLHDRWLIAQQHLLSWRADEEAEAERSFRAILAQSPNHAASLLSLVQILNTRHHVFPGVLPDRKRSLEALGLAQKAARLAPQDSRMQLALGWSHLMVERYEQAHYYFEMALRLNDHDPFTLISAAMGFCYAGDKSNALRVAQQALDVSGGGEPIHWAYHACIRFYLNDLDGAHEAAMLAQGSAHFLGGMHSAILARSGQIEAAQALVKDYCAGMKNNWYSAKAANRANIRRWLIASFPISQAADREKLETALDTAGFV